ncbi:MAG: DUF4835 family protein [Ignavibacteria bacterium]|nr:DUF4835 family protein [Ignavibacteria bacterium]
MQSQFKWFLIVVVIYFSFTDKTYSQYQDLKVTVTVDASLIPADAQEKLVNFKRRVEEYLNSNKYHDEKIPPINVAMQFNFTGVNLTTLSYDAKLFVTSQREVYNPFNNGQQKFSIAFRFLDERIEFIYNDNIPLIKNDQRFDSFLSLLDYYAYMIVGYDEDSYNPKGGNRYFQKALDICNKVSINLKGWNDTGGGAKASRMQLVQELLNIRFDNFRYGYFEYMYTGLDSLSLKRKGAQINILDALEVISDIKKSEVKSFNIDIFFDSKATEIAEIFLDYGDREVYDFLGKIDFAHQSVYADAKKRAR